LVAEGSRGAARRRVNDEPGRPQEMSELVKKLEETPALLIHTEAGPTSCASYFRARPDMNGPLLAVHVHVAFPRPRVLMRLPMVAAPPVQTLLIA
jgi:hypothetical protein